MKYLINLFIIFSFLIFVSCNDSKIRNKSTKQIKFWHFWSEPNQRLALKNLIEEFENVNDCKVEVTELSWNDGKTKLFAAFNAGNAPDVLELGSDWVAQFSSSGVLNEWKNEEANLDNFVDFSIAPSKWNNKIYCLPWIVDTRVLFYNKKLISPEIQNEINNDNLNYDNLLKSAILINGKNNNYGWGANGSDRHRLYKKIVSFFWSYGGDVIDSNGNPVINSQNNITALEKYAELSRAGLIETQRQLDAAFVEGRVGFWLSGGWLLEKIKNENPNLEFGVCSVPSTSTNKGISFAGGEYLAVNSKSSYKKLANDFVKFMTNGENSIKFCKKVIEAGFPADKNYFQNEYYKSQPNRLVFAKQLESSKMTPVHPKWLDIEQIIEDAAVEVLFGKLSAREALNNAQYKILEIIK